MRYRPRFSKADSNHLRCEFGLSTAQLSALNRALPAIADWLLPQPRAKDVDDQLTELSDALGSAAAIVARWQMASLRPSSRPETSAAAEALGQFNLAAAGLVRDREEHGLDLRDDLDPTAVVTIAAGLAAGALRSYRGTSLKPRRGRRASAEAVKLICDALSAPLDQQSVDVAARLPASRKGPFIGLAEVVWRTVLKAECVSPERSIQLYLKRNRKVNAG